MTTKTSPSTIAAKKKLLSQIAAAQRQADAARKAAKLAKLGFRQAKDKFKSAKRAAKKLKKAVKNLKAELAALAVRKKPVRARPAANPAAKRRRLVPVTPPLRPVMVAGPVEILPAASEAPSAPPAQ